MPMTAAKVTSPENIVNARTTFFGVPAGCASRQAPRYSFKSVDLSADLLSIYNMHSNKIHEAVLRRLAQGAREPVMLRESNFPSPPL